MLRNVLVFLAVIAILLIAAFVSWQHEDITVAAAPGVSQADLDALAARIAAVEAAPTDTTALDALDKEMHRQTSSLDAAFNAMVIEVDDLREHAIEQAAKVKDLQKQKEAFAVLLAEVQNVDGTVDHDKIQRMADRLFKVEKDLQPIAGRANHAHCLAHRALGEPCE